MYQGSTSLDYSSKKNSRNSQHKLDGRFMMRIKQSKVLFHFCKGLCHEDHPFRPIFDGISYNSVSTEDDLDLVMDFSKEEV